MDMENTHTNHNTIRTPYSNHYSGIRIINCYMLEEYNEF